MGNTPEENAIMKAEFYGQYFDVVICNDSGLYFEELDFEDLRQPGLNIRTPMNRDRLSDEEMIDYYSKLIAGLGGKVTAYYLDGIAVYNHGVISSFMDNMTAQKNGLIKLHQKDLKDGLLIHYQSIKKTANILLMEVLKKAKKIS